MNPIQPQHRRFSIRPGLVILWGWALFVLLGCEAQKLDDSSPSNHQSQPELIIYSGITMVRPLQKLAREFEATHNVKVTIKQGATGYLYHTLKEERKGDIFFPGSETYRQQYQSEGLLKDYVFVGYNRLALIVAEGNPKHLTSDLNQLYDPDISVVLSSPESGAVGRNTQTLLDRQGITDQVYDNVTYFTTDSHRIFNAIKRGDANLAINWYATSRWPETEFQMDAIPLPADLAPPKRLELNLLSFSSQPELAREFMAFASSKHGLKVFAEYGFLTETELHQALSSQPDHTHRSAPRQQDEP